MSKPKITLYVDIVSPFAYIAFYALQNFPVFRQCDVTYVPIFLGGLMKQCGNTPPLQVKNKDKWINVERKRWATLLRIPISKDAPPGFPLNTISIQRVLTSLSLSHPSTLPSAIALFYHNFWVHYAEPSKPENLLAIVRTVVGSNEEAEKVVQASKGDEVKKKLSENTQKSFDAGAFGLPWFVATNSKGETESYWGVDHMGQLCDHLGLERPGDKGWRALL
ncbi:HCCA isomerase/glutathione S-transferase kappa [Lophiostoma macrostomum CBS 122681]|uniref:Glutathione S-transferase kappa n=1 Tax=Lophiostoma macrostomum CBS 122681 TaxID=1314788 RepID=A0A6A6TED8_9PLEO|nr:HCCA isomerase/glutathione S-transferase kappa [Lophiostoma macrostomum CBS 122681]